MFIFLNWLISLGIISLRLIHVVAYCRSPFLYKAEKYFTACIYYILLIYSLVMDI